MKYIVVYGTLRLGLVNYNCCGSQKFIRHLILPGYDLYSLGPYPAVTKGRNKLICELHEVNDKTHERICEMERDASYKKEKVEVDGKLSTIFTMSKKQILSYGGRYMESGDWRMKPGVE